ncbi:bestrophin-like domain [Robbsia andropogonis]
MPVIVVCFALRVFHRFFPLETRRAHNEYTGYVVAIIGINYAVLLAFVAVAVWGAYDNATAVASKEAELAGNMYRDAPGTGARRGTGVAFEPQVLRAHGHRRRMASDVSR